MKKIIYEFVDGSKSEVWVDDKYLKIHEALEKQEKRIKKWGMYYEKLLPIIYSRFFWNFRNSPKNNSIGNWAFSPYDEAGFGGGYARSGA